MPLSLNCKVFRIESKYPRNYSRINQRTLYGIIEQKVNLSVCKMRILATHLRNVNIGNAMSAYQISKRQKFDLQIFAGSGSHAERNEVKWSGA